MNDERKKMLIGAFVLMGGVLLMVLIVLFGGVPTLFQSHNRYTVSLSNAEGVGPGTPVRRSGVRIGTVDTIELDDATGKVKVGILIDKKYTIWDDLEPVLSRGLLGETSIAFMPKEAARAASRPAPVEKPQQRGVEARLVSMQAPTVLTAAPEPPKKAVDPGTEIPGRVPTNPQRLLDELSGVLPATNAALIELGKAAESFNRIAPQFDAAVGEIGALARDTRQTIPDLKRTNDELQVAAKNWGNLAERLNVLVRTNEEKITKTLEDIDDVAQRMSKALSDENLRNFEAIMKNTRTASERFPSIAGNADEMLKEARPAARRLDETLREAQSSMADVRKLTQPLGTSSERISRNLEEGSERFNRVMADVESLMQVINRKDGTVQRLISDPSLYNNINELVCQFGHLMPTVERMLKDLEVFTDKIARHPESLGVGGAVRPSSGIK